ncbi:MAG: LPS export ABC transporter ATP-binding protein [Thiotrichales bacterium]|nr:MAG: LPS export ABC transporter ATP-binding protein [Thiotrichales bacterium]
MQQLSAKNLHKSYQGRKVVNNISISIASSEIIGLLGPNGAGKTTCFAMMLGLVKCDSGIITLNEHNLTALPIHLRAQHGISYLPQEPSIFRKLSVADNIMAILETRKEIKNTARIQLLEELLAEFNIEHIRNNIGISLSGGERRRVEIARCLATAPKFILLDEPFAGIDPISITDIKKIIHDLSKRGIGILITDHNVRETLDICQRAYIVHDGQIIASGSNQEILANKTVREVYLGDEFRI